MMQLVAFTLPKNAILLRPVRRIVSVSWYAPLTLSDSTQSAVIVSS